MNNNLKDKYVVIDDNYLINKDKPQNLTTHNQLVVANDNMFPELPVNITDFPKFITIADKVIQIEKQLLKSFYVQPERYRRALDITQRHASQLLFAEYSLGQELKKIKTKRGTRKDLDTTKNIMTKKDIIKDLFHLTSRQARDFQDLSLEKINYAIEKAANDNEIPTRALALSHKVSDKEHDEHESFICTPIYKENSTTQTIENSDIPLYKESDNSLRHSINFTSLFANVGIGTYYLKDMNINCAVANEILPDRAEWHKAIYPDCDMIQGDITDPIVFDKIIEAHQKHGCQMVLASPPCQTFSKANTSKNKSFDHRSSLILKTLEFIENVNPYYVMIENVPEFLGVKPQQLKDIMLNMTIGQYVRHYLEDLGYLVNIDIQSAADYGTPQDRRRAII